MHWFWMVLVCVLLLFAYWKLRRHCRCPRPSKEDRRARKEAKWHKHQLDEIEKQIEKYERKLEEIKTIRSSLGLDGVTLSDLGYSNQCGAKLRRLDEFLASEHLSLPGSSNVVALSYSEPDIRRARLVREKQSRETANRMERSQSRDMDASAWADEHRAQV